MPSRISHDILWDTCKERFILTTHFKESLMTEVVLNTTSSGPWKMSSGGWEPKKEGVSSRGSNMRKGAENDGRAVVSALVCLSCYNKLSQTGWVIKSEIYSSQLRSLEIQDRGSGRFRACWDLLSISEVAVFFYCILAWQKRQVSPEPLLQGADRFTRAPPSWPNYLPKASRPNTLTLGTSAYKFWGGHKSLVCNSEVIELRKMCMWGVRKIVWNFLPCVTTGRLLVPSAEIIQFRTYFLHTPYVPGFMTGAEKQGLIRYGPYLQGTHSQISQ